MTNWHETFLQDNSACYSPESVQSNDECDATNLIDTNESLLYDENYEHKSYDFSIDPLAPVINSQDYLSNDLTNETEEISKLPIEEIASYKVKKEQYPNMNPPLNYELKYESVVVNDVILSNNNHNTLDQLIAENQPTIDFNENYDLSNDNYYKIPSHKLLINVPVAVVPAKLFNESVANPINQSQRELKTTKMRVQRQLLPKLNLSTNQMGNQNQLSTPQITNDVLDMEKEFDQGSFDLVSFIDQDQIKGEADMLDNKSIECNGPINIAELQKILPTPGASPINKRSRQNSYEYIENETEMESMPSSASSASSIPPIKSEITDTDLMKDERPRRRTIRKRYSSSISDDSHYQPETKRPRGRPRRTEPIPIESIINLHPNDRKYAEMRLKNNEASRRSRLSRRERDIALADELDELEQKNVELKLKDAKLDADIQQWTKYVLKMAQL